MIFNTCEKLILDLENQYNKYIDNNIICYYRGFIYKKGFSEGDLSIKELLNAYQTEGKFDLSLFYGAFHIIVVDKNRDEVWFFTDNSGHCCFYYDNLNRISDSFLELVKIQENITPNYESIMEFIAFACIYSENTICNEVRRTNARELYSLINGKFNVQDKKVHDYSESLVYSNLNDFMNDFGKSIGNKKLGAVITGGSDSRVTLSHCVNLDIPCELLISGNELNKDVMVAKNIASMLNKKIHISDEKIESLNNNLLYNLFLCTDGVDGYTSRFRLFKKSIMVKKIGIDLEVGGVGGELFKNSFLNHEFPFYNFKNINMSKFYNFKMNPSKYDSKFLSPTMLDQQNKLKTRVLTNLFKDVGKYKGKHETFFNVGSEILRYRMVAISNYSNRLTPSLSPFTEVDILKLTYRMSPWKLEMNQFHRNEIAKYCPKIAMVKTDRGNTLINSKVQILLEVFKSYYFLVKVALKRVCFKPNKYKKRNEELKDIELKIRESELFPHTMEICKTLGVLNENSSIYDIPMELADRLITIGLVFSSKEYFDSKLN